MFKFHISDVLRNTKNNWCQIEEDPRADSGIPNPELLNPNLWSGFGISKSRGIRIGIGMQLAFNANCVEAKWKATAVQQDMKYSALLFEVL
jgi:hypothetical protein